MCQVQRQQVDRAIQTHPHPQAGDTRQTEIAVTENAQVDQWIGFGKLQDHKGDQAQQGDAAETDDQARLQPVLAMAFFQEHLQAAQADAKRNNAGVIGAFQQFPVRFFLFQAIQQAADHDQAGRDVDVEDVLPAPVFGQPATQGRADGGGKGGGHGKHRHAFGAMVFGQLDQGQGECQGNQRAAGKALHGAEDDHALQVPGHRAQQR
ncbi:hypothetical protein D3C81_1278290 [compost metagenome]